MPKRRPVFSHFSVSLFLSLVGLDFVTKRIALELGWGSWNTGMAIGWGSNWSNLFVIALGILVLVVVGLKWSPSTDWEKVAKLLFFAGAVANISDRFFWAAVYDWLPLLIFPIQNNLADWYITLGVLGYLTSQIPGVFSQGLNMTRHQTSQSPDWDSKNTTQKKQQHQYERSNSL